MRHAGNRVAHDKPGIAGTVDVGKLGNRAELI